MTEKELEDLRKENEKKKEYLCSYRNYYHEVKRLQMELEELRQHKMNPSVNQDGMPHGNETSDLSDYAAKVDEIEREIIKERYKCLCRLIDVRRRIEAMEDQNERDVLFYRYIKRMGWKSICVKMEYSWKQIHRIHGRALKNFSIS